MVRRFRVALALPAALVLALASLSAIAADKVVLQLRWDHQFQFAGYHAAKWQGYYAQAGLDVEIRSVIGPDKNIRNAIKEVSEGRADFGIGAGDILVARDKGAPVVIMASIFQQSPVAVISRPELGIVSPADLLNITVHARTKDLSSVEYNAMLGAEGIDQVRGALEYSGHWGGKAAELLIDGKIDAYAGYYLSALWKAHLIGARLSLLRPSSYGVDFYGDSLFAAERLVKNNPDLVQRFVSASLEGWRYALENPTEIADRISNDLPRKFAVEGLQDFNRFQAGEIAKLTLYPVVQLGHVNPDRWRRMHEAIKSAGMIAGSFDPMTFIFDPVRQRQEREQRFFFASLIVLAIAVVLLVAGSAWTFTLRRSVARRTEELRKSEERFRDLAEGGSDWFWEMDANLRYTYLSRSYEIYSGVNPKDVIGQSRSELYARVLSQLNADETGLWKAINQKIEGRQTFRNLELKWIRPDGDVRYFVSDGKPVFDKNGRFVGYRGVGSDITERKRAEESLRASEERFKALFHSLPLEIQIRDNQGRYLLVNKAYEERRNISLDEIKGRTPFEFFSEDLASAFIGRDREVFDAGRVIEWEVEMPNLSGDTRQLIVTKFPIMDHDGVPYAVGTVNFDITEQKRAEENLRLALIDAEEANQAKSEFMATMSHELRTPLNAIMGFSEMLTGKYFGELGSKKYEEYADDIHTSSEHLLHLVNDILDLSAIEAGEQPLTKETLRVKDVVADCSPIIVEAANGKNIEYSIEVPEDLPPLHADRRALRQILLNLLSNAVKFTPEGGRITLSSSASNGRLTIEVSDSGIGISAKDLPSLTDPFKRAESDPYLSQEGTGLGLAIVKALVELHDGDLLIESEPGRGTTVTVTLPNGTP